jgi:hypothetical protein
VKAARLIPAGLAATITCAAALLVPAGASAGSSNHLYRWDIIHLSGPPPVTTTLPGGQASACAASSCANMITMTGTGTFRANADEPQAVTGGGTWTATGFGAGSGTYKVTGFVSFQVAPGTLPSPPFTDGVTGVAADARAGLAVLRIAYSDGDQGVLTVSCDQPGTPPNLPIVEGITATKGFVDYWNRVPPESVAPLATAPPSTSSASRPDAGRLPGSRPPSSTQAMSPAGIAS